MALIDYIFLAVLAHEPYDSIQNKLDQWFRPGVAVDWVNLVEKFRQNIPGGQVAVSYCLISFPIIDAALVL